MPIRISTERVCASTVLSSLSPIVVATWRGCLLVPPRQRVVFRISRVRSYVRFRSNARRSIGTTFAMTRTAGPETVQYELAILSARLLCTAFIPCLYFWILMASAHTSAPYSRIEWTVDMRTLLGNSEVHG